MALILNPTNVICQLTQIVVRDDGEAVGGSEPYLWSVFFKIDGDSVSASIRINDNSVSLTLDGEPTVRSPENGSHGNLNLAGASVDAGGPFGSTKIIEVPSVGTFKTRLKPIPATIEIDPDSWIVERLDDVVLSLQDIIDSPDGGGGLCPPLEEDPSQLLAKLGVEFLTDVVGGIPGAFGALYLLMEEDLTDESTAENARRTLRDAFRTELADTVIPSISLENQEVSKVTMELIESRVTKAVTDEVFAGINWWWLLLGGSGLLVIGDQDDPLGSVLATMSHIEIATQRAREIDQRLQPDGNGDWKVRGRIGRDS